MKLVRDAIAAGIFNDLGSGSNIDLCVITKDKVEFLRPYDEANLKGERYAFNITVGQSYGPRPKKTCLGGVRQSDFKPVSSATETS